jgi:hypothetical protein
MLMGVALLKQEQKTEVGKRIPTMCLAHLRFVESFIHTLLKECRKREITQSSADEKKGGGGLLPILALTAQKDGKK